MTIGAVGPREVQDEEDDSTRVMPPSSVKSEDQPSTSGSHDQDQVQHVTSASPTQVVQPCDQPSSPSALQHCIKPLQEIIHWIK
jgi:hypothetical protein